MFPVRNPACTALGRERYTNDLSAPESSSYADDIIEIIPLPPDALRKILIVSIIVINFK